MEADINQFAQFNCLSTRKRLLIDLAECVPRNYCVCLKRPRVLIVDDNIFNIITLQSILELQFGIQSDKASNGKEGVDRVLERYNENKIDSCVCSQGNDNYKVIFMDCNMPILDGFEAT